MQTKTYFANNVPSALEVARQELGAEALLVSSRPSPAHARQFGRLEVTFAWDPPDAAAKVGGTIPGQGRAMPGFGSGAAPGNSELDEIRRQLSALTRAVGYSGEGGMRVPVEDSFIADRLFSAGLDSETARMIASAAAEAGGDTGTAVVDEMARRILVIPFSEMKPGESRMLAFLGPPGRGKTTSLVKIAVTYGLARKVPVRIYSLGAHGVGGHEQIARFAAILGAQFHACDSVEQLGLALNGDMWKGLILIDTPGLSPAEQNELMEMASFFSVRPEIEKHLVLRADARTADSLAMIARFGSLGVSRLLFTGMDETTMPGPAVDVMIRSGIPLTFLGGGAQIPEDLEEAVAMRLARAVWVTGSGTTEPLPPRAARAAA